VFVGLHWYRNKEKKNLNLSFGGTSFYKLANTGADLFAAKTA
jgi:hypothetical protein